LSLTYSRFKKEIGAVIKQIQPEGLWLANFTYLMGFGITSRFLLARFHHSSKFSPSASKPLLGFGELLPSYYINY
jgi:hypothetical protein